MAAAAAALAASAPSSAAAALGHDVLGTVELQNALAQPLGGEGGTRGGRARGASSGNACAVRQGGGGGGQLCLHVLSLLRWGFDCFSASRVGLLSILAFRFLQIRLVIGQIGWRWFHRIRQYVHIRIC